MPLNRVNGEHPKAADRVRQTKLLMWRDWERLFSEALSPQFTGKIVMELPFVKGIPQEPVFTKTKRGVSLE